MQIRRSHRDHISGFLVLVTVMDCFDCYLVLPIILCSNLVDYILLGYIKNYTLEILSKSYELPVVMFEEFQRNLTGSWHVHVHFSLFEHDSRFMPRLCVCKHSGDMYSLLFRRSFVARSFGSYSHPPLLMFLKIICPSFNKNMLPVLSVINFSGPA